ncbi:MAG TPA: tetratricopeptide repeat protein [Coleofasciculaceae cyanobacterium]
MKSQQLDVTTDSPEAIAAIDHFVHQTLIYGNAAEAAILQAIAIDPTCAIAHAYAAAHYLSQESRIGWQQALPYLQAAQRYAPQANFREQIYILAIAAWADQKIDRAIALHEAIAVQFPQDLISVQQGQYHYFYQGNKVGLLKIAETVLPANQDNAFLLGMMAFGLEQCHQLEAAERWGRQATEMNRHNPWAHHAVAHVLETQMRFEEGIVWMENLADTWEPCNSMLYTHNWWHVALYYLKRQDFQTVLNLYDRQVWGKAQIESPKDQVGAIALLLRLELQGVAVGDRWQSLAQSLLPRIHEHALPFQDLHYVYALARAGKVNDAQEMLLSLEDHAQTCPLSLRQAWTNVALPAAKGLVAYAQADWQQAIAYLKLVLPQLWAIGGSHAQRHLFDQIYVNAVQQAEGKWDAARTSHALVLCGKR